MTVTRNEILLACIVLGMTLVVILMVGVFKIDNNILAAWVGLATFIISRIFGTTNEVSKT